MAMPESSQKKYITFGLHFCMVIYICIKTVSTKYILLIYKCKINMKLNFNKFYYTFTSWYNAFQV